MLMQCMMRVIRRLVRTVVRVYGAEVCITFANVWPAGKRATVRMVNNLALHGFVVLTCKSTIMLFKDCQKLILYGAFDVITTPWVFRRK